MLLIVLLIVSSVTRCTSLETLENLRRKPAVSGSWGKSFCPESGVGYLLWNISLHSELIRDEGLSICCAGALFLRARHCLKIFSTILCFATVMASCSNIVDSNLLFGRCGCNGRLGTFAVSNSEVGESKPSITCLLGFWRRDNYSDRCDLLSNNRGDLS